MQYAPYFYVIGNLLGAKCVWKRTIGSDTADKCASLIRFDTVINRVNIVKLD